jgi:hypothetical protein
MYEALMGTPPFRGDNPIQTILKHLNETPEPLEERRKDLNILPGFNTIITHCMEKDPASRYQTMDALLEDLTALRDGRPLKMKASKKVVDRHVSTAVRPVTMALVGGAIVLAGVLFWQNLPHPSGSVAGGTVATGASTLHLTGEALHDAQELDRRSYEYFVRGDFEKAIPLLEFGVKTYREGGGGLGNGGEDNYLADNYSHIGKCYLNLKNWPKAAENYREALNIYKKLASAPMMSEAISDYATVLKQMDRSADADAMMKEFGTRRTISKVP